MAGSHLTGKNLKKIEFGGLALVVNALCGFHRVHIDIPWNSPWGFWVVYFPQSTLSLDVQVFHRQHSAIQYTIVCLPHIQFYTHI